MKKLKLTITTEKFHTWYFEDGQDSENERISQELADKLIEGLRVNNKFTITIADIFKRANKDAIPVGYFEEYDDEDERELGDLESPYEIKLIKVISKTTKR